MNKPVHRTKYATLTVDELIRLGVQCEESLTELGKELLYRLEFVYDNNVDDGK